MNGRASYSISEGNNPPAKFGIFPDGMLYVKSPLDRELKDYYALTVVARDGGTPVARTSSVSVTIHVIDENDNAPKFSNETFAFYIAENEAPADRHRRRTQRQFDLLHCRPARRRPSSPSTPKADSSTDDALL